MMKLPIDHLTGKPVTFPQIYKWIEAGHEPEELFVSMDNVFKICDMLIDHHNETGEYEKNTVVVKYKEDAVAPYPKTTDECVGLLLKHLDMINPEIKSKVNTIPDKALALELHASVGKKIQENYLLWYKDGALRKSLEEKGYTHINLMSNHIIETLINVVKIQNESN